MAAMALQILLTMAVAAIIIGETAAVAVAITLGMVAVAITIGETVAVVVAITLGTVAVVDTALAVVTMQEILMRCPFSSCGIITAVATTDLK